MIILCVVSDAFAGERILKLCQYSHKLRSYETDFLARLIHTRLYRPNGDFIFAAKRC